LLGCDGLIWGAVCFSKLFFKIFPEYFRRPLWRSTHFVPFGDLALQIRHFWTHGKRSRRTALICSIFQCLKKCYPF